MFSLLIRFGLVLLVLNILLTPAGAFRNSNRGSSGKYDRGYKEPGKPQTFAGTSSGLPSQNTTRRGLGISAWGIVILVIVLIVAGMGFYYFSICFDVCHQSKTRYDKMSLPNMA